MLFVRTHTFKYILGSTYTYKYGRTYVYKCVYVRAFLLDIVESDGHLTGLPDTSCVLQVCLPGSKKVNGLFAFRSYGRQTRQLQ